MLNMICAESRHLLGMDPVAVARFLSQHQRNAHQETVISTEAAHGIFVSSAAEKSASRPPPSANPHRAFVLVFSSI
jgi:hypothetical protein